MVANAAGINVDKTRIIAIIFSTVLAGLGHLIFAQNLGSLQTYGAHEQVGLYAGAAILVGGASIVKASNGQALLGALLFHLLFIVVSGAGRTVSATPPSASTSACSSPTASSLSPWSCTPGAPSASARTRRRSCAPRPKRRKHTFVRPLPRVSREGAFSAFAALSRISRKGAFSLPAALV